MINEVMMLLKNAKAPGSVRMF